MSTSRFTLIQRRHILARTVVAPLIGYLVTSLLVPVPSSFADCCGGGGSGGLSGRGGIPSIESFARGTRVQLQVFPGQRNQNLEIFNAKTGERLGTVPFGGSSGLAPFAVTVPPTNGAPVTYSMTDATTQESGSSGSGSQSGEDSGSDKDGCCDPPYSATSYDLAEEQESSPGDENCEEPGEGEWEDTVSEPPDDSGGGGPGNPISPEPPSPLDPPSTGGGNDTPPSPPPLFDSLVDRLQQTQGGASVSISLGKGAPALKFAARHLQALDLSSPDFGKYFQSGALSKWSTGVTLDGGGLFRNYQRLNNKYLARAGDNGFRSIVVGPYISNLVPVNANTWELRIYKIGDRFGLLAEAAILDTELLVSSAGHVTILYHVAGGGLHVVQPSIIWRFQTSIDPVKGKVLDVLKIGSGSKGEYNFNAHVRYWQTVESGETHTYMQNVGRAVTTKVIDREDGANLVRGRITYQGTGASEAHEGWIMRTGPDYTGQPTPGSDPDVTILHFGGAGNTIWQWGTNGLWEKKTVAPSIDAVSRRVTTLRPWGAATTPLNATESNAHRTVEEINKLKAGALRTTIVSLAGTEISRTVDASNVVGQSGGSIIQMTDTRVTYPAGLQSVPSISYSQRYSSKILHPGAGQISYNLDPDGTKEWTTYKAGSLQIPTNDDPWTFIAMEWGILSDYPAREVERKRELADGRTQLEVTWRDEDGRLRMTKRYVLIGETRYFVEAVRQSYRGTQVIKRERTRLESPSASDWMPEFEVQGTVNDPNFAISTDETGVTTTSAYPSFETLYPSSITRQAIPGTGGMPAVPAQVTNFTYDSANRITSRRVMQGATVLKREDITYTASGELRSVTLNNAITREYKYDDYGLGGRRTREYRYAFDGTPDDANDNVNLFSTTITDWRGETVSRTGPGVIEESHTELAAGVGRLQKTTHWGPSGSPLVSRVIEEDGRQRKTGEKANVPNGQWRTWTYDALGRATAEKINNELVRSWAYDGSLVTETVNPSPNPVRSIQDQIYYIEEDNAAWEYRISGLDESKTKVAGFGATELSVRKSRDHSGDWTTVTMTTDSASKAVIETTTRPNVSSSSIRKYRGGLAALEQVHSGVEPAIYTYDELGRVVFKSEFNGARTTTIGYDPIFGATASVSIAGNDGTSRTLTKTYYQPNESTPGRLKSQTENGLTTYYRWTLRGQLDASWGVTYPLKYSYDAAGRLWKIYTYRSGPSSAPNDPSTWPIGDVSEWIYYPGTTALQTKKDAANAGPVYEYDPRGWLSKRTLVRTQSGGGALFALYSYNRMGELTGINYNDATPDVTISRDNKGRISAVTDGGGGWTYSYDPNTGLLERETNTATGSAVIYQRDSAGRRTGYSYWDKNTSAPRWATWGGWGYDPVTGRLNGISTPEGWISQSYETGTDRPSSVAFSGLQSTRGYDALGRLKSTSLTTAGFSAPDPALTRTYVYNALGQRQTVTEETGDFWEYSYNSRNEVTGGAKKRGASILPGRQYSYNFDVIGNRTQWGLSPSPNGRMHNALNQPISGSNSNYVTVVGKADDAPTTTLTLNGQTIINRNGKDFAASITAGNFSTAVWQSVNVTETKQGQAPTQTTGYLFQPRTTAADTFDADGNLKLDDRWSYTWDAENRLISQETRWQGSSAVTGMPILRIEYKYDSTWRRVEKKVSTWNPGTSSFQLTKLTKFAYEDRNLIAEWEAQPSTLALARTHHWGLDWSGTLTEAGGVGGLLLTRHHTSSSSQTTSCVPAYDGTGNILALYDTATGKRAAQYEYGPFGEPVRTTGPAAAKNPFRWSTKITDVETSLVIYDRRPYNPATGRWLSRDPISERGGANLTSFVLNNPVNYFDILGLQAGTGNPPPAPPPPPSPVNGGAGANGWKDSSGNSEDGYFEDQAGGRDNPNVGGFNNGKELLDQMENLSKNNCCIKNFKIASHGRGSSRPSIPSSEEGSNGFYGNGDTEFGTHGPNGRTTDDLKKAITDGKIKFCGECSIEIYGCNLSPITQPLSAATGCNVVAAGGFCSPKGNGWFSDDYQQGNGPGDQWYQSTGGGAPTPIPGGPVYVPKK